MTGKDRFIEAFSQEGASEVPIGGCYHQLFIRDHWNELTDCPWWYQESPVLDQQLVWQQDVIASMDTDWWEYSLSFSKQERTNLRIEISPDGIFRVNKLTGLHELLREPVIGGDHFVLGIDDSLESIEDIGNAILKNSTPIGYHLNCRESGRCDLADALTEGPCASKFHYRHITSPLSRCVESLWGFEEFMVKTITHPHLIRYACEKYMEDSFSEIQANAETGCDAVWIEDVLTDMLSPEAYMEFSIPYIRQLTETIRHFGMNSIHYFCGDPRGKLDMLITSGVDALAFEESKKGFNNDIVQLAEYINGRCALLGNVDTIGILHSGTEEDWRAEIKRQLIAGKKNKNRFIMSTGSPVLPETTAGRYRLFCEMVRNEKW